MKKRKKYFFVGFVTLFGLIMVYILLKLNHNTDFRIINKERINYSVYSQLRFLKTNREKEKTMQEGYPEGFVFYNAIYLLTWSNTIKHLSKDHPIYLEGKKEVDITYLKLKSQKATPTFHQDLNPKYGAFYNGWLAYCLGKKIELDNRGNSLENMQFDSICCQILNGFDLLTTPYLNTYQQGIWPSDNFACIAALNLHDKVFDSTQNKFFIYEWLKKINISLSPSDNELPPHSIDFESGKTIEKARGSSSALVLVFLSEINKGLSKKYYAIYKNNFFDKRYYRLGIREYPKGYVGEGDIDSGPVILDIGAVASIVGMQAAILNKDLRTYKNLMRSLELFGIPITFNQKKKYLFGQMPMADLFIAWARSKER